MKPKIKLYICWAVLLLHISLIFSFSLQDATASTVISVGVTKKIKDVEEFKDEISTENGAEFLAERKFNKFEAIIRKLAHFSLFFLLGVYLNLLLEMYKIKDIFKFLSSVLFAGTIAFLDETIQLFSAGRAGKLIDVMIDMSGAFTSAILFFIGGKIYEKNKKRCNKMDS